MDCFEKLEIFLLTTLQHLTLGFLLAVTKELILVFSHGVLK